ncbi:hypothetical protein BD779DRAFT_904418 [Infundibulicybe gibba]|nr:hypothetical protein BD779DRAFT_904418 [Infundibulicybe gibba]
MESTPFLYRRGQHVDLGKMKTPHVASKRPRPHDAGVPGLNANRQPSSSSIRNAELLRIDRDRALPELPSRRRNWRLLIIFMAWFLLLLISAIVGIMAGILVRLPYPPSNTESTSNLSLSQTAITITTNIPSTTTVSTTPVLTTLLTNFQTSTVGIPPRSSGRETLSSIPTTLTAATIIPSASQHMLETTTHSPRRPPPELNPHFLQFSHAPSGIQTSWAPIHP